MDYRTVSPALKARVTACIAECIKKAGVTMPMPTIKYDINSARLGGQAHYGKHLVRFNPVFLNAHTDHYIKQTVTHEAAHLIARAKFGRYIDAHGPEWKRVMVDLGVKPDRCHSYTVPAGVKVGKQMTKHAIHCERCGEKYETTSRVVNKMHAGRTYRHKSCGGKMVIPLKLSSKMVSIPTTTAKAHTAKPLVVRRNIPAATGSKLDICRALLKANRHLARAQIVNMFVNFGACTPAGAATYYAKLIKE
jgi:SprT protein